MNAAKNDDNLRDLRPSLVGVPPPLSSLEPVLVVESAPLLVRRKASALVNVDKRLGRGLGAVLSGEASASIKGNAARGLNSSLSLS